MGPIGEVAHTRQQACTSKIRDSWACRNLTPISLYSLMESWGHNASAVSQTSEEEQPLKLCQACLPVLCPPPACVCYLPISMEEGLG